MNDQHQIKLSSYYHDIVCFVNTAMGVAEPLLPSSFSLINQSINGHEYEGW